MPESVITANRLTDGVVVWLSANAQWSDHLADAAVFQRQQMTAALRIGDIRFEKGPRRLTLVFNRFRWEAGAKKGGERVRSALQLGGVLDVVDHKNFDICFGRFEFQAELLLKGGEQ